MSFQVINQRGFLNNTIAAIESKRLTIGFLGGSITAGSLGWNWPTAVCDWFADRYPSVRLRAENAALGATGSDLAAFRAKGNIIDRGCDLVFVEYAVNDWEMPTSKRNKTREGVLRQLLAQGNTDVVIFGRRCTVTS